MACRALVRDVDMTDRLHANIPAGRSAASCPPPPPWKQVQRYAVVAEGGSPGAADCDLSSFEALAALPRT